MKKAIKRILCVSLCVLLLASGGAGAAAAEGAENKPTRISVCINGDTSSSRGFCWYTDVQTDTKIIIRNADGRDITGSLTLSEPVCTEWEGKYMHKKTVGGMAAGGLYYYSVGDGEEWESGSFTTDDRDDVVRFINIADVQASIAENFEMGADTLKAALEMMPNADFVSNCGDFTNDSTNAEWDLYDASFGAVNKEITIVPVSGNHDGMGVPNWFNNMFNLDASESVQTKNGVNYSFDYGNAHFAVLNTNDLLSISNAQLKWLENDMNSTDKDWKIVFMHKSPYTLGKDGKWPDAMYLQRSLTKVLDKCNVDIAFSGHDHMYLRTKPLTGNKLDENGVRYVLSGTAGSKRYEIRSFLADHFMDAEFIDALTVQKLGYGNYWNGTDWESKDENNIGGCFSTIEINATTLTLNAYILGDQSDKTKLIDSMTLTKQSGENKATYSGENTTSAAKYALDAVPSILRLAVYAFGSWLPKFLIMVPDLLRVVINDGIF